MKLTYDDRKKIALEDFIKNYPGTSLVFISGVYPDEVLLQYKNNGEKEIRNMFYKGDDGLEVYRIYSCSHNELNNITAPA